MGDWGFVITVGNEEVRAEIRERLTTTFWEDFTIADRFGEDAVRDTYRRVEREWRGAVEYCELDLVLNHKLWQHHEARCRLAAVYDELYYLHHEKVLQRCEDKEFARTYFKICD